MPTKEKIVGKASQVRGTAHAKAMMQEPASRTEQNSVAIA